MNSMKSSYLIFLEDEADAPSPKQPLENYFRLRICKTQYNAKEPNLEKGLKNASKGIRIGPTRKFDEHVLIEDDRGYTIGIVHKNELAEKTYELAKKRAEEFFIYIMNEKNYSCQFLDLTSQGKRNTTII